jgi:ABC-type uncharacterized transport system substrate-binding protein
MLSRRTFFGGLFFFIVLMGGLSKSVFAHPHTFVNTGAQFVLSDGMLSEVRIDWVFDEMTTGALLGLSAMEGDRPVDMAELNGMWGQALPAPHRLKDFVYIETNGNSIGIPAPSNVQLSLKNGQLRYMATFYVSQPVNATKIWFLDASNYIAFTLNGNNIRCLGGGVTIGTEQYIDKVFLNS